MSQVRRLDQIPAAQVVDRADQIAIWQDGRTRIGAIADIVDGPIATALLAVPTALAAVNQAIAAVDANGSRTNAKLAPMPAATVKANIGSATGQPSDVLLTTLASPGNPVGEGIGRTITGLGGDSSGGRNSTSAFAAASASTDPRETRITAGSYVLDGAVYLGDKPIRAEVGARLRNALGAASDAYMMGGIQVAGGLDDVADTAPGSISTAYSRVRFISGNVLGTAGPGKKAAPLSSNVLFYNGRVANAYDVPSLVNYAAIQYGTSSPASGCAALLNGAITVGNVAAETQGRSEITPISVGLIFLPGYTTNNVNAYNDIVVSGPIDKQPAYLSGWTVDVKKRDPGQVLDATHASSLGIAISTGTGGSGFGTAALSNQTSYPLTAMFAAAGHSGAPSVASGVDAGADYGAKYGLLVGGTEANNNWRGFGSRSKFNFGACLQDWTNEGLRITGAHPIAAANAAGINSDYDIWSTALLLKSRAGAPTPLGGALYLYQGSTGRPAFKGTDGVEHYFSFT